MCWLGADGVSASREAIESDGRRIAGAIRLKYLGAPDPPVSITILKHNYGHRRTVVSASRRFETALKSTRIEGIVGGLATACTDA